MADRRRRVAPKAPAGAEVPDDASAPEVTAPADAAEVPSRTRQRSSTGAERAPADEPSATPRSAPRAKATTGAGRSPSTRQRSRGAKPVPDPEPPAIEPAELVTEVVPVVVVDEVPPSMPGGPVVEALLEAGVTPADVAAAAAAGQLGLLAIDAMVFDHGPRHTAAEAAETTGLDLELLRRIWRALGFPNPADDEPYLDDADLGMLATVSGVLDLGRTDVDHVLQMARVIGSSTARIAETQLGVLAGPKLSPDKEALLAENGLSPASFVPSMAVIVEKVWRRHLQLTARRRLMRGHGGATVELAVGFADLVGFTGRARRLSDDELAPLVARFEDIAHDVVVAGGGRVIKTLGDEVMFCADAADSAAAISLELSHAFASDELLSDVRVGLAHGPVLERDGDLYGSVVNLAHRIIDLAAPSTVVVSAELRDAVGDDPSFVWRPMRPRPVRDYGRLRLWQLRSGDEPVGDDDLPTGEQTAVPWKPELLKPFPFELLETPPVLMGRARRAAIRQIVKERRRLARDEAERAKPEPE